MNDSILITEFPICIQPELIFKNIDDVFSEGNQEAADKLNCAKVLEGNWFTIPYIASQNYTQKPLFKGKKRLLLCDRPFIF